MSSAGHPQNSASASSSSRRLDPRHLPLLVTLALFLSMVVVGAILYPVFLSPQVFLNLLIDNAFLCVAAVGATFVILTGGIDLSVGAVIAFTTVLLAMLVQQSGWHPLAAIPVVLALGSAFGAAMGVLIQHYRLQPFVVTLAGMFLARGAATLLSVDSISIAHPFHTTLSYVRIPLGFGSLSIGAVLALLVVAAGIWIAHATRFGRTVYAIGGSETSARLMGLPVGSTLVGVYALSGFCSALAGVTYTFYMLSGYSQHALGLELDAIAAVVIGGADPGANPDHDRVRRYAQLVVDAYRHWSAAVRVLRAATPVRPAPAPAGQNHMTTQQG